MVERGMLQKERERLEGSKAACLFCCSMMHDFHQLVIIIISIKVLLSSWGKMWEDREEDSGICMMAVHQSKSHAPPRIEIGLLFFKHHMKLTLEYR